MKVKAVWCDDVAKPTVQIQFQAGWTWKDLEPVISEAAEMATSSDNKVSILFDYSETDGKIPANFIGNMTRFARVTPPNVDVVYILSRKQVLAQTMTTLINRIANMHFELRVISSVHDIRLTET